MGDFNHKGNLSNLPIEYGDRVVVMVGVRRKVNDNFSLGFSFTPLTLPIRGEYNDYGAIENVDETPATKKMAEFFGMDMAELVNVAERSEAGCENQVEDELNAVMDKLKPMLQDRYAYMGDDYTLGYFMEHESVFDEMVRMGNESEADHKRWGRNDWIETILEELGYEKHFTSNNRNGMDSDNATWTHETLPAVLIHEGYVMLLDEYKANGNEAEHVYPMKYNDIYSLVGCETPENHKASWLGNKFDSDMEFVDTADLYDEAEYIAKSQGLSDEEKVQLKAKLVEKVKKVGISEFNVSSKLWEPLRNAYFINSHASYGLFYGSEYYDGEHMVMSLNTRGCGHLKPEYKDEFVKFAAFIRTMEEMNLTWGVSNYYGQEVSYEAHKNFIGACQVVIDEKIKNREDW